MKQVIKFFSLTFIASWALWIATAILLRKTALTSATPSLLSGLPFLLGTFAPSLVALVLTAHADGRRGVRSLLTRVVQFPSDARWYLFAVSFFVIVKLGVAALYRLMTGAWPSFGHVPFLLVVAAVCISTPVQAGEEIGWRGYALPRLARRLGLGAASLVLGVIWACWHLPFFFIPGADNAGQSFPVYLLAVTAISVAMAWVYWNTNGSVLITMLMHAAINNTAGIVSSSSSPINPFSLKAPLVAWLTAGVAWLFAAYFLVRMRQMTMKTCNARAECLASENEGQRPSRPFASPSS